MKPSQKIKLELICFYFLMLNDDTLELLKHL